MNMKRLFTASLMVVAIIATGDLAWAGSATPESILVVPARKRMVQLAFELSRCKEIGVVTYNTSPALAAPLIHAWNGQEWVQVSMEDYVEGRFMSGDPKHVFLLGDASSLPLKMMDGPTWYKDLNRITTLDIATIVNQVGNKLKFSARQWKWLAQTYGMKIEDQNTERRRYGRWGAPGKELDLAPAKLDNVTLPPTAPIADPIVEGKIEASKDKIEPVKSEMPMPPKVATPTAEKSAAAPESVKPEPPKVEAPKGETPVVAKPAVPMNVTLTPEETKVAAPAQPAEAPAK